MGNKSKLMPCSDSIQKWTITVNKVGDKVAQLVRCRTIVIIGSLVRFPAGALWSVLGQDSLFHIASVCPAAKWVPSIKIRQCLEHVRYMLPIALEYPPGGLKWFSCVQCLLGEEGRVSASVDTTL